jgi:hypothetical protein
VFQNIRLQRMTWQIVDFPFHQYMALCHHDLVSSSYNSFWQFGVTTVFMFRKQKFESKQGKINKSKFSFVSLSLSPNICKEPTKEFAVCHTPPVMA